MNKKNYESPNITFTKTELFEDVADKCWARPNIYLLTDPTDEDNVEGHNRNYADLKDYNLGIEKSGGCNGDTKDRVKKYLLDTYGKDAMEKQNIAHYLTEDDVKKIMNSGGGNMGTPLKADNSEYIHIVRSR